MTSANLILLTSIGKPLFTRWLLLIVGRPQILHTFGKLERRQKMFTTRIKILGLMIVLLVLAGCTPDTAVPATIPPTRTVSATETGTAVAEILVTAVPTATTSTATVVTTRDPNQTTDLQTLERAPSTPVPTNTPRPTVTPSPTPTPVVLDLPEWIVDPGTNVMLVTIVDDREDNAALTFINADSDERFGIYRDRIVSPSWVWKGDEFFLRLYYGTLHSGSVITEAFEELINLTTGEVIAQPPSEWGFLSPDGRYFAVLNRQEDRTPLIKIIDQETGLETEVTDPFNGRYRGHTEINWSPDGALLAALHIRFNERGTTPDYGLVIYTASGEIFRQYENKSTLLPWSPVPPYRILYTDTQSHLPCILNVVENQETCLEAIADWAEEQNVKLSGFIWSPDGSKISFVHWSYETHDNGVCYLELATDDIFCPVTPDDLQVDIQQQDVQMFPDSHFWSPDGRYIVLFFNPQGLESDDGSFTFVAIVDSNGQNFRVLGQAAGEHPTQQIWRPSISSPSEE